MTAITEVKTSTQRKQEYMLQLLEKAKHRVLAGEVRTIVVCTTNNTSFSYEQEGPDLLGIIGALEVMQQKAVSALSEEG